MNETCRVGLYVNGWRVAQDEAPVEPASEVDGRALVRVKLPADLCVVVQVDKAALAAIHEREAFGMKHLRALLDHLLHCDHLGCGEIALYGDVDRSYCGAHGEGHAELPYAPVVRHIQRVVAGEIER